MICQTNYVSYHNNAFYFPKYDRLLNTKQAELGKSYSRVVILVVKTPTPTQHNTTVGFDTKMTIYPHPHRNFSVTSRPARELKFGTDIHYTNLIKIT